MKRQGKVTVIDMAMEKEDIEYRRQIVQEYKPDVEALIRYLPWLEEKAGSIVSETFTGSGIKEHSIAFPVYDSTLLNFVKTVQRTRLLDRNYRYIYSGMDSARLKRNCRQFRVRTLRIWTY